MRAAMEELHQGAEWKLDGHPPAVLIPDADHALFLGDVDNDGDMTEASFPSAMAGRP